MENIRKLYPESVLCYCIGNFYECFGRDAYIMAYLFGYKITHIKDNIPLVGFPKKAISKVQAKLEQKKINYLFLDVRNNYDVDYESDNKNLNEYNKVFFVASNNIKLQNRIEKLSNELIKSINEPEIKEKLDKIEEIIYEGRKV